MANLSIEDKAMYAKFIADNPCCWACRVQPLPSEFSDDREWSQLHNCHIVGGAGRVHDRRVLVRGCKAHHWLNEGETLRHEGKPLPRLTLENMLWLKRRFCVLDVEFIRECRRKKNGIVVVPEPLPLEPIGCKLQSPF